MNKRDVSQDLRARIERGRLLDDLPAIRFHQNSRLGAVQSLIQLECLKIAAIREREKIMQRRRPDLDKENERLFTQSIELEAVLSGYDALEIEEKQKFWTLLKGELDSEYEILQARIAWAQSKLKAKIPQDLVDIFFSKEKEVFKAVIAVLSSSYEDSARLRNIHGHRLREGKTIRRVISTLEDEYTHKNLKKALAPDSELFHKGVLAVSFKELGGTHWMDVEVRLNTSFLFSDEKDDDQPSLHAMEAVVEPAHRLEDIVLDQNDKDDILAFIRGYKSKKLKNLSFLFFGPSGVGKTTLVHAIAAKLGKKIISFSAEGLSEADLPATVSFLITKYRKSNCMILFDECESLWYQRFSIFQGHRQKSSEQGALKKILENTEGCLAFASNFAPPEAFMRRVTYCLELKRPSTVVRRELFKSSLETLAKAESFQIDIKSDELDSLADQYALAGGFFNQAVTLSSLKGDGVITAANLAYSLEKVSKSLGAEDKTGTARIRLSDLTISGAQKATLDRIVSYTKAFHDRKENDPLMPQGVTALFQGPPGTGKTVVAEALAKELGLRFKLITASDILSKWVGDSEKMIAETFEEAEKSKCLLFLDEAEGLLGKRTEAVRSWEKTQSNEWLKRIEMFQGVFVAATNHKEMLDHAFARRFLFQIEFDYPAEAERFNYLKNHLGKILDNPAIGRLSKNHRLSFGELRNALVQSKTFPQVDEEVFDSLFNDQLSFRSDKVSRPIGIY